MPNYDYRCEQCSHITEKFHSISEEPEYQCEKCGTNNMQRMIGGGAGIIFKGSGFYVTDYKKSSQPAEKSSSEKKTATATTSKEAKPAVK